MLRPPIDLMLCSAIQTLPAANAHRGGTGYQLKFDGFRVAVFRGPGDSVEIMSRAGKLLTSWFPEIVRVARESLPPGVVLDGELVIWDQGRGRLGFPLLQRRLGTSARAIVAAA